MDRWAGRSIDGESERERGGEGIYTADQEMQERLVTFGIANPISMVLIPLPYRRNSNLQTIRNASHTELCAPPSLPQ